VANLKSINKKRGLTITISVLIIIVAIPMVYLFGLISIFSCDKIDDRSCIRLFETYTQNNFPKSGVILKKNNLCGLNDGWEAAVVKVTNKEEFQVLKCSVKKKPFLSAQQKKQKVIYFGSGIQKGYLSSDTIIKNYKEHFVLEFVNESQIMFFEKSW